MWKWWWDGVIINYNLDIPLNDHEDDFSSDGKHDRINSIKTGTLYLIWLHIRWISHCIYILTWILFMC